MISKNTLASFLVRVLIAFSFLLAFLLVLICGGYEGGYVNYVGLPNNVYLYAMYVMPFLSLSSLVYLLFVHRPRSWADYLSAVLFLIGLAFNAYLFVFFYGGRAYFGSPRGIAASYAAAAAGPLMSLFYLAGDGLSFFLYREDNERLTREGSGKTSYLAFLGILGAVVLIGILFLAIYPSVSPASPGYGSSSEVLPYFLRAFLLPL